MNAKNLLLEDMRRHVVLVTLPEEKKRELILIEISASTSLYDDFCQTYPDATAMHRKLAEKLFGKKQTQNVYGTLFDADLKVVFAFNRAFADYDRKKEKIIYTPVDELLLDAIPETTSFKPNFVKPKIEKEKPYKPNQSQSFFGGGGGGGTVRYSLTENEEEEKIE